jgi:hypothetical protein
LPEPVEEEEPPKPPTPPPQKPKEMTPAELLALKRRNYSEEAWRRYQEYQRQWKKFRQTQQEYPGIFTVKYIQCFMFRNCWKAPFFRFGDFISGDFISDNFISGGYWRPHIMLYLNVSKLIRKPVKN